MDTEKSSYYGYRFPAEIIRHTVWLYHRFCLSLRDVEDLLAERGIEVSYESIRKWCARYYWEKVLTYSPFNVWQGILIPKQRVATIYALKKMRELHLSFYICHIKENKPRSYVKSRYFTRGYFTCRFEVVRGVKLYKYCTGHQL